MLQKLSVLLIVLPLLGAGCTKTAGIPRLREPAALAPSQSTVGNPVPTPSESAIIIEYKNGAFAPSEARVTVGGTVTFKNSGPDSVWPASDIHPTHLLCPGFDARRALSPGQSWSFTFREAKTCPFHNHLSATEIGRIVIE